MSESNPAAALAAAVDNFAQAVGHLRAAMGPMFVTEFRASYDMTADPGASVCTDGGDDD